MSDKRKTDKKRLRGLTNQAMSMSFFLMKVLGIRNKELIHEEITHRELAKIFPDLKRTGYNYILDNPQVVYNGDVVLVRDANNAVVPYVIKNQIRYLDDLGMDDVMDDDWYSEIWSAEETETTNVQDYDLHSMSIYDLEQLLKLYSQTRQTGNYQIVRRELIGRKDSTHACHASKEKAHRKELKLRHRNNDDDEIY